MVVEDLNSPKHTVSTLRKVAAMVSYAVFIVIVLLLAGRKYRFSRKEKKISYINAYMWNLEKWYR